MFNKKIATGIAALALVAGAAAPAAFAWPQDTSPSFDSSSYSVPQGGDRETVQLNDVKEHCIVNFTLNGKSRSDKANQENEAFVTLGSPKVAGEYILRGVVSDKCTADAGDRNWVYFYVGTDVWVDYNSISSWNVAGKNIQLEGQVDDNDGATNGGLGIDGFVHVKIYEGSKLLANVGTDEDGYFSTELARADFGKKGDHNIKFIVVANKNFYSYVPPTRYTVDVLA